MFIKNNTKIMLVSKKTGNSITILDTTNGIVGNVVAGIPITECVDNSLDTLVVTVKGADKRLYEPFDGVMLTVADEEGETSIDFVVVTDNLQSYQKHLKNYTRTVQLAEQAKILEKTKIFSLNLTNMSDTLLRQFEKALNNAELLVSGESYNDLCRFQLSDDLIALITGKSSEDFWFSNTDLRTVLDTMLMSCNCRATVNKIEYKSGDISKIVIGYRALSTVRTVTPQWTRDSHGEIVNDELDMNCQDYAGKIVAKGLNSQIKNSIKITDVFKTASDITNDTTATAFLPFPIGESGIKYFGIKRTCKIINDDGIGHHFEDLDIDISSRLIPMEKYNVLSKKESQSYLPYSIGSTVLPLGEYVTEYLFSTKPNVEQILKDCANATIPRFSDFLEYTDWYSSSFTCTYYPQIDTAVEITKPNTYDRDVIKMGIMASQTENTLDIGRHGRQLLSLAKRTGNAEWYIDVEASHYRRLLPLMSKIDDGYVVYKREVQIYDNFVKCRYYLSKDYNAIETKAGVNRERHLYDIPLESDECPLLVKQYLVFSKKKRQNSIDRTFNNRVFDNAFCTCLGRVGDKISFLLMRSKSGSEIFPKNTENSSGETPWAGNSNYYVFVRPTLNYGQAKTMNFVASVLDNYSVDYSRDGYVFSAWGDGGNRITYCRYVSKNVATMGECDTFELNYAFKCNFLESPNNYDNYYELVKSFPISDMAKYETATKQPLTLNYHKDRTQRPVFFTTIECVSAKENYDDIVIGTAFCRDNCLVTGKAVNGLRLFVSTSTELHDNVENVNDDYVNCGDVADFFELGSYYTYDPAIIAYRDKLLIREVALNGDFLDPPSPDIPADIAGSVTLNDAEKSITINNGISTWALIYNFSDSEIKKTTHYGIEWDSIECETNYSEAYIFFRHVHKTATGVVAQTIKQFSVHDEIPKRVTAVYGNLLVNQRLYEPTGIMICTSMGTKCKITNLRIGIRHSDTLLRYSDPDSTHPAYNVITNSNIKSWAIANEYNKELYIGANGSVCNIYANFAEFPPNDDS